MERHRDGAEPQKGREEGRAGRPEAARRAAVAEKRSVWARRGDESPRRRPLPQLVGVSDLALLLTKLILIKI